MNANRAIKILLLVWVVLWALFLARPYFKKGLFKEYSSLLGLSLGEKRAAITGRELYDFIKFCKKHMKPNSTYKIIGLEKEDPLVYRRCVYYLYPAIDSQSPEFLLVYKAAAPEGPYRVLRTMEEGKYILKKGSR